jgi:hexosaminidase
MKPLVALLMLVAAPLPAAPLPLVPLPVEVERGDGSYTLNADTAIRHDKALATEAALLAADLERLTGSKPKLVREELRIMLPSEIRLDLAPGAGVPAGGYRLEVTPKRVLVQGKDPAGTYHGTRTLLQLLPPAGDQPSAGAQVPALKITDHPRFGWRGMHLDVGRHIFPLEEVRGFLDWMAFHKFNVFHIHLTEDQGWRMEIRKYPKLTEVGAWRESSPPYGNRNSDDGRRYGGFYTQDELRELVAYAAARHITIVPEIEIPGHAAAAIAAYPELGNDDIPGYAPRVMTRWGVHPYTYAPKEETFAFLDDVLAEVCEVFPSKYIHIGGDEAPKDQWKRSEFAQSVIKREGLADEHGLQSYFIRRVEKMLEKRGRRLIGWDEIREGGLSPDATVMSWRGEKGGIDSAREGHDVVMAPNSHTYLDYYQAPAASELAKGRQFEAIGGFLPISKVYSYDPVPAVLDAAEARHVLGVQAQLWSEYFKTWDKVEYHAFPRIAAVAEVAWTPVARKNYEDFRSRLDGILEHYDAGGVNRGEPFDPPARRTRDGSKLSTSLGTYQDHWPELAFDGRAESFFWADRALRAGDHLTLELAEPAAADTAVKVVTGGPASRNGDKLEHGVLEASADGSSWDRLAGFVDGTAAGTLPAGTTRLRLRVTAPQTNWLIVHEIELK